eukprot:Hpha_TRINITY_DN31666_c0_g1::TRINITY_DN31666_c0_g1_i1::g.29140::m.29140
MGKGTESRKLCEAYLAPFPALFRRLLQAAVAVPELVPVGPETPQRPLPAVGGILRQGWLLKLGGGKGGRQNWKRRWFVVWGRAHDFGCYYYKTSSDALDPRKAKGRLELGGYGVREMLSPNEWERFGPNGVMLLPGGDSTDAERLHSPRRTWYLRAATQAELQGWMHAFSLAAAAPPVQPTPWHAAFLEGYARLREACDAPRCPGPSPGCGGDEEEHLAAYCLDRLAADSLIFNSALPDGRSLEVLAAAREAARKVWKECERQGDIVVKEAKDLAGDLSPRNVHGVDARVREAFAEEFGSAVRRAWLQSQSRVDAVLRLVAPAVRRCMDAVVMVSDQARREVVEARNEAVWASLAEPTSLAFDPLRSHFPSCAAWQRLSCELSHWGALARVRQGVYAFLDESRARHLQALREARLPSMLGGGAPRSLSLAAAHAAVEEREEDACTQLLLDVAVRVAAAPVRAFIFTPPVVLPRPRSVFAEAAALEAGEEEEG